MKKMVSILLSLTVFVAMLGTTAAANNSTETVEFVDIWNTLRASGDMIVNDDGLLAVNEHNKLTTTPGYDEFIRLVTVCNESIVAGILVADAETCEVTSVLQQENEYVPNGMMRTISGSDTGISPMNAAHGCSVQACNLLNMCQNNYDTLHEYHMDMLQLVLVNPNLSPGGATVGFWVSKVEPGGDWDYKVQPGFAPYNSMFCCYFNSNFNHVTSEYIGNFNYGYTGSYLFDLETLHLGSKVVSGFDPADVTDWPAIDAGFENAPNT